MVTTLIIVYLVIGALASGLIWAILIASKRRENKGKRAHPERSESQMFREPNTKPSKFHS
jgi:hypothetical protein